MQDINNVWYKKQISCRQDINFLQTRYLLLKPDSPFHRCQFILRQQSQILKKVQHKDLKYNKCYKHRFYPPPILADVKKSIYICNVFFIVLDLRLTKVGVQRYSFFYAHTFRIFPLFPYKSTYSLGETPFIFLKTLFMRSQQGWATVVSHLLHSLFKQQFLQYCILNSCLLKLIRPTAVELSSDNCRTIIQRLSDE